MTIHVLMILFLIILDQVSKYLFGFVQNTGALFGLFSGQRILLITLSFVILGILIYYYPERKYRIGLNLLIAGTIGNLIDRIYFGYVRDFIDLTIWPVFNFADVYVTVGVLYLIYILYKK